MWVYLGLKSSVREIGFDRSGCEGFNCLELTGGVHPISPYTGEGNAEHLLDLKGSANQKIRKVSGFGLCSRLWGEQEFQDFMISGFQAFRIS